MSPDHNPKPINLLRYHRPKISLSDVKQIPPLSQLSKQCLRNLVSYRLPKPKFAFPRSRCAAVLVALFVGRHGDLYVLLSRRSATLRSYAGDTSLPGGKVDLGDRTFEDTARREAFEEIGLPRDRAKVPLLCVLEPFLASDQLLVTPVVVLILDNTLRPILNKAEVASLFSHPLHSFLSSKSPFPHEPESFELSSPHASDAEGYHTSFDIEWTGSGVNEGYAQRYVRIHSFLTGREAGGTKPVFGLTAWMLIHAAAIGYNQRPSFELNPPSGAPSTEARIAYAMLTGAALQESCRLEGIKVDRAFLWSIVEKNRVKRRADQKEDRRISTSSIREGFLRHGLMKEGHPPRWKSKL
ncbi:hypothetical protein PC9H_004479 [Pleurotus ostreatus]|uniref:Nudix hydrolase domain-containing protein n=1 Tax=Pleurotus ostreatus TaxID=5322 RepID=A0A8H6ZYN6_PLEOS|nr:uncharacterized protein PC9H_004479 [Pleurotus ostreatus]KAF7432538.1 hypothetical protein PC9H_004479 [Pleurotus ostreatus]KAJ8698981.1 8-oxo-dGTP diphosphatase [Pleurotus ostreatus]